MKKQLFDINELAMRTIERVSYIDNHMFFFFTDNTFTVVKGSGWEERDVEIMEDSFDLEPNDYNIDDLKALGILSGHEYARLRVMRDETSAAKNREYEIQRLVELGRKYPDVLKD